MRLSTTINALVVLFAIFQGSTCAGPWFFNMMVFTKNLPPMDPSGGLADAYFKLDYCVKAGDCHMSAYKSEELDDQSEGFYRIISINYIDKDQFIGLEFWDADVDADDFMGWIRGELLVLVDGSFQGEGYDTKYKLSEYGGEVMLTCWLSQRDLIRNLPPMDPSGGLADVYFKLDSCKKQGECNFGAYRSEEMDNQPGGTYQKVSIEYIDEHQFIGLEFWDADIDADDFMGWMSEKCLVLVDGRFDWLGHYTEYTLKKYGGDVILTCWMSASPEGPVIG